MPIDMQKTAIAKFPLRLMPSVRRTAQRFSEQEGVSLNQFINLAVAEKLAHLEHDEWVRNRKTPLTELAVRAVALLDQSRKNPVEVGDELPEASATAQNRVAALDKTLPQITPSPA